jgi:hypothetical protein
MAARYKKNVAWKFASHFNEKFRTFESWFNPGFVFYG